MAWGLVSHTQAVGHDGATSAAINTSGADLLVLVVSWDAAVTISVSDSAGNTWTPLTPYAATYNRSGMFYAANAKTSASHTFTVSGTTSSTAFELLAISGSLLTAPFDIQNGAVNNSSPSSIQTGPVTPSQGNSLVIAGISINSTSTSAPTAIDSGFTISDSVAFASGVNYGGGAAYLFQGAPAAVDPTWTISPAAYGAAATIAVFKPAAVLPTRDPGRQSRNFRRFLARERPHQTARVGLNPPAVPVPPAETAFDPGKQSRNFRQFERPRHRVPCRMSAPAAIAPPVSTPFVVTCIIG